MPLEKIYYVNVGPNGTFKPSGNRDFDSTRQDVDALIDYLRKNQRKKVVLYFHGGLVNQNSGMEAATRITQLFTPSSPDASSLHPISFVWETGAFETILSNLSDIYQTEFFQKLLHKVLKIAGKKLGIELPLAEGSRGLGSFTEVELKNELSKESPFEDVKIREGSRSIDTLSNDEALKNALNQEVDNEVRTDTALMSLIKSAKNEREMQTLDLQRLSDSEVSASRGILSGTAVIKALVTIIFRVIKRHIKKRDHGFYPTIIEEILRKIYVAKTGAWVWNEMKNKAEQMWISDPPSTLDQDKHAGGYFLQKLDEYARESGGITVDVIGHSAGSIVISYLIDALEKGNSIIKLRNVIFMAPACTCQLFKEKIIQNTSRFTFFRMFTMSDQFETKDRMLSIVYTRSLLYFISGLLEGKGEESDAFILGLQRHISGWPGYNEPLLNEVKQFIDLVADTVVYSVTGGSAVDGLRSSAIKHGNFDNDSDFTLASIAFILNK
jgi:hypothetical protein